MIDELYGAPLGPAWSRSFRFYENRGFVFIGPKLPLVLPGI